MLAQVFRALLACQGELTAADICNIVWALVELGCVEANRSFICKSLDSLMLIMNEIEIKAKDEIDTLATSTALTLQPVQELKCANPTCFYLVHSSPEAGPFCCGRCWCRFTKVMKGR